jgi:acetyl-CoA C-acetyltransferase
LDEIWIIDAVRTPRSIGKPGRGAAYGLHPQRLLANALRPLADRNGIVTDEIDDVIIGCGTPIGKQGYCIARMASLLAGYGERAPGVTIERFCGSALSAVNFAAMGVGSGMQKMVVAGGIEMMSYTASLVRPPLLDAENSALREAVVQFSQGVAADIIATVEGFSRADVDAFALASHERAAVAIASGHFEKSLVPIFDDAGNLVLDREEFARPGTNAAGLAALKPSFAGLMNCELGDTGLTTAGLVERAFPGLSVDHVHHPGNSSGVVDGAAAVLLTSRDYAQAHGMRPRARIRAIATAGDSAQYMLNATVPAARKALELAGLGVGDIDLFEVNEAFATVPLKFMKDLGVPHDKINVNGGAIALGHPIGATGAMLVGMMLDELERRNLATGLITLCTGGGMAPALVVERI